MARRGFASERSRETPAASAVAEVEVAQEEPGRPEEGTDAVAPQEATDPTKKRRRRGSRGGRGKKKPTQPGGSPEAADAVEARDGGEGRWEGARTRASRAEAGAEDAGPQVGEGRPPSYRDAARTPADCEARPRHLRGRRRAARGDPGGRPRRRGLPRAARAPLDRREHLPRRRRQRAARHGGGVRRDRAREERLPLRRRDRRPRARGPEGREEDPGPDPPRRDGSRPGGQGPDEVEGRAAHDRDLAPGPLPRVRPERRGLRRLAAARGRRAHTPQGDREGPRREGRRDHRPHRSRGRVGRGHRARSRLPAAALEDDPDEDEGRDGAEHRLRGGGAPAANRPGSLRGRLLERAHRRRQDVPADRQLPEEDVAAHDRARPALPREAAAVRGIRRGQGDPVHARAQGQPSLGRLSRLRLRRGVHGHRREHGSLRRLARQVFGRPARGHDRRRTTSRR